MKTIKLPTNDDFGLEDSAVDENYKVVCGITS